MFVTTEYLSQRAQVYPSFLARLSAFYQNQEGAIRDTHYSLSLSSQGTY